MMILVGTNDISRGSVEQEAMGVNDGVFVYYPLAGI